MSRNKQVDRLREGMQKYWTGEITDPVGSALSLMESYRKSVERLCEQREMDSKETEDLFIALNNEIHAVFSDGTIITREDGSTVRLGQLGSNVNSRFDTVEDKARLITIIGMIIVHLRDSCLQSEKAVNKLEGKNTSNYNRLHKVLQELGIWEDVLPGTFDNMLDSFVYAVKNNRNDKKYFEKQFDQSQKDVEELQGVIGHKEKRVKDLLVRIEQQRKDYNLQLATAKQYRKELDAMREDNIRRVAGN